MSMSQNHKIKMDLIYKMAEEGNNQEFLYKGFTCLASRMPQTLHINGYVKIPQGHKYFGVDYNDIPVTVHGGLTYCRLADDQVNWIVGFDTAHYMDLSLSTLFMFDELMGMSVDNYRTMDYVKDELIGLVDQLITLELPGE